MNYKEFLKTLEDPKPPKGSFCIPDLIRDTGEDDGVIRRKIKQNLQEGKIKSIGIFLDKGKRKEYYIFT